MMMLGLAADEAAVITRRLATSSMMKLPPNIFHQATLKFETQPLNNPIVANSKIKVMKHFCQLYIAFNEYLNVPINKLKRKNPWRKSFD